MALLDEYVDGILGWSYIFEDPYILNYICRTEQDESVEGEWVALVHINNTREVCTRDNFKRNNYRWHIIQ